MSAWDSATARAGREPELNGHALPNGVVVPSAPPLIVVDHFDPTMIDMPQTGAVLRVRAVSKLDAQELVHTFDPPIVASERVLSDMERELGRSAGPRARVSISTRLLVRSRVSWNDVRYHLVSYEADG